MGHSKNRGRRRLTLPLPLRAKMTGLAMFIGGFMGLITSGASSSFRQKQNCRSVRWTSPSGQPRQGAAEPFADRAHGADPGGPAPAGGARAVALDKIINT